MPEGGLFGWREWKFPRTYFDAVDHSNKPCTTENDGSFNGDPDSPGRPGKYEAPGECYNPVRYPNLHPVWSMYGDVSPYIKTIFTDMSGVFTNGAGYFCERFEVPAMECMEYYGLHQGSEACKDFYDDLMECRHKTKRNLRVRHMFRERHLKNQFEYLQGKRTWEQTFEDPPKFHAFLSPWQDPKYSNRQNGTLS